LPRATGQAPWFIDPYAKRPEFVIFLVRAEKHTDRIYDRIYHLSDFRLRTESIAYTQVS